MRAIAATIAIRAADEDVAEELHLDLPQNPAPRHFALTDGGIEAEGAGVQAALFGDFGLRKDFADVNRTRRCTRRDWNAGFAESGLIHEDDLAEGLRIRIEDCRLPMEDDSVSSSFSRSDPRRS